MSDMQTQTDLEFDFVHACNITFLSMHEIDF